MSAATLQRKLDIVQWVTELNDDVRIQRLHEQLFGRSSATDSNGAKNTSNTSESTVVRLGKQKIPAFTFEEFTGQKFDLEATKEKQGYQVPNRERIHQLIEELNLTEPLEELLEAAKGKK